MTFLDPIGAFASAPAHVKLRIILAYLGITERGAEVQLSIGRNPLRAILRGEAIPQYETKEKIRALSWRAPFGEIKPDAWPEAAKKELEPGQTRRRPKTDGRKA
jgi:hypothetical protein